MIEQNVVFFGRWECPACMIFKPQKQDKVLEATWRILCALKAAKRRGGDSQQLAMILGYRFVLLNRTLAWIRLEVWHESKLLGVSMSNPHPRRDKLAVFFPGIDPPALMILDDSESTLIMQPTVLLASFQVELGRGRAIGLFVHLGHGIRRSGRTGEYGQGNRRQSK